jgi:alkylated DNA repair dioxygenase AlkB
MSTQPTLFAETEISASRGLPGGFHYRPDLINAEEEAALVAQIVGLPLKPYEFQHYLANRRVATFGFRYDYGSRAIEASPDLPPFLTQLRQKVATFAGRPPDDFRQVMVTEYTPGAGIGWHRDRPQFGDIVGVSLLSPANFRLRRRDGDRWQRASRIIAPRSAYIMTGEARHVWEHSIPEMETLRYSLTFRTMADAAAL